MPVENAIFNWRSETLLDKPFFQGVYPALPVDRFVSGCFSLDPTKWVLVKDGSLSLAFRARPLTLKDAECFLNRPLMGGFGSSKARYLCGYIPYIPYSLVQSDPACFLRLGRFWSLHDPVSLTPAKKTQSYVCNIEFDQTDAEYFAKVGSIHRDIRSGRYYQLNLLRWANVTYRECGSRQFEAQADTDQKRLFQTELLSHWARGKDGKGCVFASSESLAGQSVVSFSPESFVEIEGGHVFACPIKGTAATHEELKKDYKKNTAELAMITDLMRNDLYPLCKPGSLKVVEPEKMLELDTLVHLQSTVQGMVKSEFSLHDLFCSMLPAGSITGAPKPEVCKAIEELESRERGPSMGCFFVFDTEDKKLTSRVLIRSLKMDWATQKGIYGVGSGVTLASNPAVECEEVKIKTNILSML